MPSQDEQQQKAKRLVERGVLSSTHLLALMYAGEMCAWLLDLEAQQQGSEKQEHVADDDDADDDPAQVGVEGDSEHSAVAPVAAAQAVTDGGVTTANAAVVFAMRSHGPNTTWSRVLALHSSSDDSSSEGSARCAACLQAAEKLLRCSQCRCVAYCSRECQRAAWRTHRTACGLEKALVQLQSVDGISACARRCLKLYTHVIASHEELAGWQTQRAKEILLQLEPTGQD